MSLRKLTYSLVTVCLGAVGLMAVLSATPAAAGTGSHTGGQNAQHMQLRESNDDIVCKVYDTSRDAKPVAADCPTSGTYTEILWNTQNDGSWKEIARRSVTLDDGGGGGGDGTHTGGQNAEHMQLRFNNDVVCKVYHTSRNAKPVATGCPTKAGDYREFLWNTASDGSWEQVSVRTVTIGDSGPPPTPKPTPPPSGDGTHTGVMNAEHMQLRFNNNVVCKVYHTSRSAKPVARQRPATTASSSGTQQATAAGSK